jgi:hypothetical protein
MKATVTDASTAHNGGFIIAITFRIAEETEYVRRREGTSDERILSAGNEVSDSLDAERRERRSIVSNAGSMLTVDPVECSVEW